MVNGPVEAGLFVAFRGGKQRKLRGGRSEVFGAYAKQTHWPEIAPRPLLENGAGRDP